MESEEDEVALVVERDGAATGELGVLREQRVDHPADLVPEPGVEIVENYFGVVGGLPTVVLDVFAVLDALE